MTKKIVAAYGISVALLLVSMWCGISIGSVSVPISTLWDAESNPTAYSILWNIRMPRVVLAALVGAALAIAGAAFQGLLKNPLADPYTLGISSGCFGWRGIYVVFWCFSTGIRAIYIADF